MTNLDPWDILGQLIEKFSLPLLWLFVSLIVVITCCVCSCLCNRRRSNGTPIQSQQRNELPIMNPTAPFQDQRDHQRRIAIAELQQLQVDLRPIPIVNSVTPRPSAPKLDPGDFPPTYEEAVKIISSKV